MNFSKHNIYSLIDGSDNHYIVNLLSGSADILDPEEFRMLGDYMAGREVPAEFLTELELKGYVVDETKEVKLYKQKYLDFIDSRDDDEIQLFFVPNYSCNFACTYCYQDEYSNKSKPGSQEMVDAFFRYINLEFAGRRKYLTIFGGEPLMNSPAQKEMISNLVNQATDSGLEICIVTNGYSVVDYIDILKAGRIREIQITLDGIGSIHDSRRFLKGGGATFDKIVEGIDACLRNELPVNLRMVIDKENIGGLPALADFAIARGWTASPYFKTQVGRNYELHHCQATAGKLFDRFSMYEQIYKLTEEHPQIAEFYQPSYSITKYLAENGTLPDPLFDSCPACKTEWAFDYTGQIYSCTATVGKEGESLGTFYPAVTRKDEMIKAWEERDVISIEACSNCSMQLACGGGCGAISKNNTGTVHSPDCRPVKELLGLGFSAFKLDQS